MLNLSSLESAAEKSTSDELDKFTAYIKEKSKLITSQDIGKCLSDIQQQINQHDKLRLVQIFVHDISLLYK